MTLCCESAPHTTMQESAGWTFDRRPNHHEQTIVDCVGIASRISPSVKELANRMRLIADELNSNFESDTILRATRLRNRVSPQVVSVGEESSYEDTGRRLSERLLESSPFAASVHGSLLGFVTSFALFAVIYFTVLINTRWRSSVWYAEVLPKHCVKQTHGWLLGLIGWAFVLRFVQNNVRNI